MRFLADENIPKDAIVALRQEGHDVSWVAESPLRGKPDEQVWMQATEEDRVLVSGDLDFPIQSRNRPAGLILLRRFDKVSTRALADALTECVRAAGTEIEGRIFVLQPGSMRSRRL